MGARYPWREVVAVPRTPAQYLEQLEAELRAVRLALVSRPVMVLGAAAVELPGLKLGEVLEALRKLDSGGGRP